MGEETEQRRLALSTGLAMLDGLYFLLEKKPVKQEIVKELIAQVIEQLDSSGLNALLDHDIDLVEYFREPGKVDVTAFLKEMGFKIKEKGV